MPRQLRSDAPAPPPSPSPPLLQGLQGCLGGCETLFPGQRCYSCHLRQLAERDDPQDVSYACDLGNAQCVNAA